ncbi:MAG: 6-phospho-beta-glucosidase [Acidobacteriota bacterium]|nr:6-phospho-beta-glucosidase [Acidobacteriota bacterium]
MKVAIIGGAGVRVPLLVGGLSRSDLGITDIALYDIDRERLGIIADLATKIADGVKITSTSTPEPAVGGADFVISSIRVGGAAQRAKDEAAAIALGAVGQETVGPVGFAMAVRTIPAMVEYGRMVARLAPRAWLVNFSNPVSLITQAVHQETDARLVGICDTPMEMFEDAAHALGLPASVCSYDYFGLNHLGWLRDVLFEGEGQLHRIWNDDAALKAAYRSPLFEPERLRKLRLLPTEYLYYYYRPEVALEHIKRAGSSRGAAVAKLTEELFKDLRGDKPLGLSSDPLERYQQYLAARDSSYMQLETGVTTPRIKPDWAELSGYDRIALMTMRAIVHNQGAVIPLDVANRGTLPFLEDEDIVEVQCRVDASGPHPQPVAPIPDHPRELIERVKTYERATVKAALTGNREELIDALALNPLVSSREQSAKLVEALL